MTPLSLAIWWFDDGSIISNGRKGVFCTDGFTKKQVKTLAQYLQVVWQIRTVVGAVSNKRDGKKEEYYRLWLRSSEELKKFFRIILPFVPVEQLLPKVILLYKDSQLQQRWISEIERLSKFPRRVIKRYLKEKKKRWQQFQKKR